MLIDDTTTVPAVVTEDVELNSATFMSSEPVIIVLPLMFKVLLE